MYTSLVLYSLAELWWSNQWSTADLIWPTSLDLAPFSPIISDFLLTSFFFLLRHLSKLFLKIPFFPFLLLLFNKGSLYTSSASHLLMSFFHFVFLSLVFFTRLLFPSFCSFFTGRELRIWDQESQFHFGRHHSLAASIFSVYIDIFVRFSLGIFTSKAALGLFILYPISSLTKDNRPDSSLLPRNCLSSRGGI